MFEIVDPVRYPKICFSDEGNQRNGRIGKGRFFDLDSVVFGFFEARFGVELRFSSA